MPLRVLERHDKYKHSEVADDVQEVLHNVFVTLRSDSENLRQH